MIQRFYNSPGDIYFAVERMHRIVDSEQFEGFSAEKNMVT